MNPAGDFEKYRDIIDLPHHQSATRPHMSVEDRAAQFSPFAALTGYEDAVKETARLTDERIELDEYSKEILNQRLNQIREKSGKWVITYFVPDERKQGGSYVTKCGIVLKIKRYEQLLVMEDRTEIPILEIVEITPAEE